MREQILLLVTLMSLKHILTQNILKWKGKSPHKWKVKFPHKWNVKYPHTWKGKYLFINNQKLKARKCFQKIFVGINKKQKPS